MQTVKAHPVTLFQKDSNAALSLLFFLVSSVRCLRRNLVLKKAILDLVFSNAIGEQKKRKFGEALFQHAELDRKSIQQPAKWHFFLELRLLWFTSFGRG
jgi:hypothetical protein